MLARQFLAVAVFALVLRKQDLVARLRHLFYNAIVVLAIIRLPAEQHVADRDVVALLDEVADLVAVALLGYDVLVPFGVVVVTGLVIIPPLSS